MTALGLLQELNVKASWSSGKLKCPLYMVMLPSECYFWCLDHPFVFGVKVWRSVLPRSSLMLGFVIMSLYGQGMWCSSRNWKTFHNLLRFPSFRENGCGITDLALTHFSGWFARIKGNVLRCLALKDTTRGLPILLSSFTFSPGRTKWNCHLKINRTRLPTSPLH